MRPLATFAEQLFHNAATMGQRDALVSKRGEQFQWRTWSEIANDVQRCAGVLKSLGIAAGDRIVQIAENRYEWIVLDLALQTLGAVHVPLHTISPDPTLATQIVHSGASHVVVSENERATSLAEQPLLADRSVKLLPYKSLFSKSQKSSALPSVVPDPESLATIIYTSGTSGAPKGVMLSHHNLLSNARGILAAFGATPSEFRLNFLPFSHIFARMCDLYVWLMEGSRLGIAGSKESVLMDCALLRPSLINGVPFFFEKIRRGLRAAGVAGIPGAIQKALGGGIRMANCGGAALPEDLYDDYQHHGIPLQQGYGLTEASPVVTACTLHHNPRGSVGKPLPGVEVRLAVDGEILVRGPNVMLGYYNDPAATAEVIRDGWLHTGDLGSLDDDGSLRITGRKKELIVLSSGRNVLPAPLESLLTADPLIAQAVVVGDGHEYPVALIVPDFDEARSQGLIADNELLKSKIAAAIAHRLAHVAPYEQIRRFALLTRPFSIEAGELTSKLSLRRGAIAEHFAQEIESLYAT